MAAEFDDELHRDIADYLRAQLSTPSEVPLESEPSEIRALSRLFFQQHEDLIELTKSFPRGHGGSYTAPEGAFLIDWEYVASQFEWVFIRMRAQNLLGEKVNVEFGQFSGEPPRGLFTKITYAPYLEIDTLGYCEVSPVTTSLSLHAAPSDPTTYYFFGREGMRGKATIPDTRSTMLQNNEILSLPVNKFENSISEEELDMLSKWYTGIDEKMRGVLRNQN